MTTTSEQGDDMQNVFWAVAFSLSSGALVLFIGVVMRHFGWLRAGYRLASPDCLGQLAVRHDEYCSEVCPLAARCALLVMDDYMRRNPGLLFSSDSSEQR